MKNIFRCCCLLFLFHVGVSFRSSWKQITRSYSCSLELMSISFDRNTENSVKNMVDDLKAPIVTLVPPQSKNLAMSKYLSLLIILTGFVVFPLNVWSDDKGTKTDKYFESCMSKCVFSETRPPPVGSSNDRLEAKKSRGEILGDCKKQCATTKEQLLIGAPKKKAAE